MTPVRIVDLTPAEESLADLIRERDEGNDLGGFLWQALMRCRDCDHRIIDHDEVAFRCLVCRCDQSERGLSAYADDRLLSYGRSFRAVYEKPA